MTGAVVALFVAVEVAAAVAIAIAAASDFIISKYPFSSVSK